MIRKALSLAILLVCFNFNLKAQNPDSVVNPNIQLTFPLVDAPYIMYAAKTVNNGQTSVGALLKGYANPSMQQSLNITTDLYTAVHYGIKTGLNKLKNGSRFKKPLSRSGHYLADFVLMYAPLGGGWLHEEYHRSIMTIGRVNSFNDMNKFPIGASTVALVM